MGYVIIDLEFNNMQNITKFYPNIYNEQKDLKELDSYNEIIEIGAIKLNSSCKKLMSLRHILNHQYLRF